MLTAVVVGGVGLVLFLLGFDGHTTEALPFGVAGLIAGAVIAQPSWKALRAASQPEGAWRPPAGAPALDAPPSSVKCENCGSAAPLRLDLGTHAECAHCHHRTPLPRELAGRLEAGAAAVRAQARADRQIAAVITTLPERERELTSRLSKLTRALVAGAALAGLYGLAVMRSNSAWQGFVAFALLAGPVSWQVGRRAARELPRVVLGIVGRWSAHVLPGVKGLTCRVCGAPLPERAAPVLRCEYCEADNLASPEVISRVAANAQHAHASVLSLNRQSREADELAAFSLVALPAVVLVVWFAIGAFTGGVGLRMMHGWFGR